MKNLSLILNVVLLVAVIVLYVLHFSGGASTNETSMEDSTSVDLGPLTVAYVNSDSLLTNYDFFKESQENLEKKRDELETQYQTRARGLESEINSYQRTRNSMTIGQIQAVEEDLQKKQQNLMVYRDQLSQALAIEENNAQNEIYDRVAAYVKEYAQEHSYQVVLNYQRGTGVLYANDGLEITNEILSGLNDKFIQEKEGTAVKSDSIP